MACAGCSNLTSFSAQVTPDHPVVHAHSHVPEDSVDEHMPAFVGAAAQVVNVTDCLFVRGHAVADARSAAVEHPTWPATPATKVTRTFVEAGSDICLGSASKASRVRAQGERRASAGRTSERNGGAGDANGMRAGRAKRISVREELTEGRMKWGEPAKRVGASEVSEGGRGDRSRDVWGRWGCGCGYSVLDVWAVSVCGTS